jgi:uracil-DNA glycosylase
MSVASVKIHPEWYAILKEQFESDYFRKLKEFLLQEKKQYQIFPPGSKIFSAFDHTPISDVKVVIIGQDPYHGPGQANGMCFSVTDGIPHPPSLKNIFKEIENDLGIPYPVSGDLSPWARQGVFLLNATLTVRARQAGSHQKKGWEEFTDSVIKSISNNKESVIFLLWGSYAIAKSQLIDSQKHYILKTVHPSPLSAYRGFFGCQHFSKTNILLRQMGKPEINWAL